MNEFYLVNDLNDIIDGYDLEGARKLFSYALKAAESRREGRKRSPRVFHQVGN